MKTKIIILSILVLSVIFVWQKNSKQSETISAMPASSVIDTATDPQEAMMTNIADNVTEQSEEAENTQKAQFVKPEFQGSTGPVELLTL